MGTITLEVVPANRNGGVEHTRAEARKIRTRLIESGLDTSVRSILIPQVVPEDEFRPVALQEKLDPLDSMFLLGEELDCDYYLTQVTVDTPMPQLRERVAKLEESGASRIIFIGAPRNAHVEHVGPSPVEAYRGLQETTSLPLGAILIPTRASEHERFSAKLQAGATFGVTQLLFSDAICRFLDHWQPVEQSPEIMLSFGYVPKAETRVGLFQWMIWDDKEQVQAEVETIRWLADKPFAQKKAWMVDHYKRVIDGALRHDLPLGIHLEAPYGVSKPAMETFAAMLDVWSPPETAATQARQFAYSSAQG